MLWSSTSLRAPPSRDVGWIQPSWPCRCITRSTVVSIACNQGIVEARGSVTQRTMKGPLLCGNLWRLFLLKRYDQQRLQHWSHHGHRLQNLKCVSPLPSPSMGSPTERIPPPLDHRSSSRTPAFDFKSVDAPCYPNS